MLVTMNACFLVTSRTNVNVYPQLLESKKKKFFNAPTRCYTMFLKFLKMPVTVRMKMHVKNLR